VLSPSPENYDQHISPSASARSRLHRLHRAPPMVSRTRQRPRPKNSPPIPATKSRRISFRRWRLERSALTPHNTYPLSHGSRPAATLVLQPLVSTTVAKW